MKLRTFTLLVALATGLTLAVVLPERKPPTPKSLYENAVKQTVLVATPTGQGSAFLFKRHNDRGLPRWFAWTAEHVVGGEQTVKLKVFLRTEARLVGETVYTAKVLEASPSLDVALLFVDASPNAFLAAEFADLAPAQQGDFVFTVGNFLGDDFPSSVSIGIISQVGIFKGRARWPVLDQTTAPVYPGSSGGPIFNAQGLVLGIVVARVDATLGFFVPVRAIDEWATEQGYGWAVRGYSCPPDWKGKFLVAPVPPPEPPKLPPDDQWYWR